MADVLNDISVRDLDILRRLGARVAEIAADPVMEERRSQWKRLNALQGERPLLLAEIQGVMDQTIPMETLECEGETARNIERYALRSPIYYYEQVNDDMVIEPCVYYSHIVNAGSFGVEVVSHCGENSEGHGSMVWEPPIQLPDGMAKLRFRELTYDREATERSRALLEWIFEGILEVKNHTMPWWTTGMTGEAIRLIGLEEFMLAMYDEPDGLHALMAFLRADLQRMLDWHEQQGILTLNNDNSYIGSGSAGYCDELPQADYTPGSPVRIKDLWGLSESQETVLVSPELFEEFVFQYQLPVISRFGLAYYGCCEPVHNRWHLLKQIPNLRKVSVSPWADEALMAEYLGTDYVYCRKPNPTLVSTGWDEAAIRQDLRHTIELTKGMNVEIVIKDVHTLAHEPWRLGRWVAIAREEIARVYGEYTL